jgi:multicomponent Na+:H+ antiporter subunit G
MTIAVAIVLAAMVLTVWLATIAFFRLPTAFQRIHVITFVNVVAGGLAMLAAFLGDGVSSRSLKCAFIWLATLPIGALLSHVTGRALHIREGERR